LKFNRPISQFLMCPDSLAELLAQFVESSRRPVENGDVAALRQSRDEIVRRSASALLRLFNLPSDRAGAFVCGGPLASGVLRGGLPSRDRCASTFIGAVLRLYGSRSDAGFSGQFLLLHFS
jgi:hypothetical protein